MRSLPVALLALLLFAAGARRLKLATVGLMQTRSPLAMAVTGSSAASRNTERRDMAVSGRGGATG